MKPKHLWSDFKYVFLPAVVGIAALFCSCGRTTFDSVAALETYLSEKRSEYTQSKAVNGFYFALQYRPTDLWVAQTIRVEQGGSPQKTVDSLRSHYGNYLYFNLSIQSNAQDLLKSVPNNFAESGRLTHNLLFELPQKVHLFTNDGKELELVDFVFPRLYEMATATQMLFVFKNIPTAHKVAEELRFTLEETGLGVGELNFYFSYKQLQKQPRLNFNKIHKASF